MKRILELLQDQLLLAVVAELVGAEKVAVVESRQVVDVDLSRLQRGRCVIITFCCVRASIFILTCNNANNSQCICITLLNI